MENDNNTFVVEGTIIKLDVTPDGDSIYQYRNLTQKFPLDEKTFIVADDDNNVFIIFRKEEGKEIITKDLTEDIHIVDKFTYDFESLIHCVHYPTPIPNHLRRLIVTRDVTTDASSNDNIPDSVNTPPMTEDDNTTDSVDTPLMTADDNALVRVDTTPQIPKNDFFSKNYQQGSIYPLADMRRHPDWEPEFRKQIKTKRMNVCKSCKKALKRLLFRIQQE